MREWVIKRLIINKRLFLEIRQIISFEMGQKIGERLDEVYEA